MRRRTSSVFLRVVVVVGLIAASITVAAAASPVRTHLRASIPPPGRPAPARLLGYWEAQFVSTDEQTSGTWHLRFRPGHSLKLWNVDDPVDNSPLFEAGPVSFRTGHRMVFARRTARGICTVGATYRWTLSGALLRFRLLGRDGCRPRFITFTPHPWHRSS
jgi:hypothetical protein